MPDALARGELLYRDVVYWFGPFTPYFQAVFLRVLGSSFTALVVAGAVAGVAVLALLFAVLRRVAGRFAAAQWTALAIPVLLFMPNAGGDPARHGIPHLARRRIRAGRRSARLGHGPAAMAAPVAAGVCAGLAGLCRTEWGVVAARCGGARVRRASAAQAATASSMRCSSPSPAARRSAPDSATSCTTRARPRSWTMGTSC